MISFFSNFISEHQIPFCDAMYKNTNGEFRFIATKPISKERLELRFSDHSDKLPYVIKSYVDEDGYREAMRLGYESDVVIIGSAPDAFIEKRLAENKLTFRYSERFFKKFRWRFDPRALSMRYKKDTRYRRRNLHMLCASAYTAPDCRFIFSYPRKTYKWGYFPKLEERPFDELSEMKSRDKTLNIIWVSRFIKLKHPEEVICLAKRMKSDNVDFRIEMLGVGELREEYERIVSDEGLSGLISFSGPCPPAEVLGHMRKADVFLFTSDKNEGWGAVMNEAMSSACAVVACREIGSVPFLINHGENGLIYDKHGPNSLYHNVSRLIREKDLKERLQKNAYDTIKNVWNAETATERLLYLIDCIRKGDEIPYTDGPCSRC